MIPSLINFDFFHRKHSQQTSELWSRQSSKLDRHITSDYRHDTDISGNDNLKILMNCVRMQIDGDCVNDFDPHQKSSTGNLKFDAASLDFATILY